MSTLRARFARAHERDPLVDALTARRTPGPKPRFTETVDVAFTPEQVRNLTRQARREQRSRNSVIRDAVEAYLAGSGGEPA